MAADLQKTLDSLKKELEQIVENYNKAKQVMENCTQRIYELKGGIAAIESVLNSKTDTNKKD